MILIISFIFNFKPVIFYQILRLLNICVVLYIFSEAIGTEYSTSHMAPHIYWFLCMRTGSRHGPWNSLPLYLGETIGVQPASTRQLTLDFTSCYWFSPYHICFACRNFICQHWSITETTVKKAPIGLYFVRPSSLLQRYFSMINWKTPTSLRDSRLFHILTSFVHVGPLYAQHQCRVMGRELWQVNASLEEIGTYLSYPILSYLFRSASSPNVVSGVSGVKNSSKRQSDIVRHKRIHIYGQNNFYSMNFGFDMRRNLDLLCIFFTMTRKNLT